MMKKKQKIISALMGILALIVIVPGIVILCGGETGKMILGDPDGGYLYAGAEVASVLSEGNIRIVAIIALIAVIGILAIAFVKKKIRK